MKVNCVLYLSFLYCFFQVSQLRFLRPLQEGSSAVQRPCWPSIYWWHIFTVRCNRFPGFCRLHTPGIFWSQDLLIPGDWVFRDLAGLWSTDCTIWQCSGIKIFGLRNHNYHTMALCGTTNKKKIYDPWNWGFVITVMYQNVAVKDFESRSTNFYILCILEENCGQIRILWTSQNYNWSILTAILLLEIPTIWMLFFSGTKE